MSMTFADLITHSAGSDVRVRWADGYWTGDQLVAEVEALTKVIQASGAQRIASRLDNGPHWLLLDLAIRRLNLVHVPLPTFFSPEQVAHALMASAADVLVVAADAHIPQCHIKASKTNWTPDLQCLVLTPNEVSVPADTAVITFTSGTTGNPKGVCLSASALLTVARSLADASAPLAPKRHLCLMPLSTLLENIGGVYAALLAGAEVIVPSLAEIGYSGSAGLDLPTLLGCLQRYQPESAILVPQLLLALVMAAEHGAALPLSWRFLAVGGARVGEALIARAELQGLPVFEGYGLSECASVICLNTPSAKRAGSVGKPLPHARVFVHEGELMVEGVRMLGYLGDAEQAAACIATGDLGFIDNDGFVYITGRRKNQFITSFGRNVSPEWVEGELLQQPLIAQAVVFGEARPFNVAVVWLRQPDTSDAEIKQILATVNAALPDYAGVRQLVRADAPFTFANGLLTSNGRPRRDAIHQRYAQAVARCYGQQELHQQQGAEA